MAQHWISYASHRDGLLGVVIVEAAGVSEALSKGREIAPDAASRACGIEAYVVAGYDAKWLNRLITKPEINEIGESGPRSLFGFLAFYKPQHLVLHSPARVLSYHALEHCAMHSCRHCRPSVLWSCNPWHDLARLH
jgi:hypothetical protein